jgi:ribosomal protein S18 acetylase RimI-like enzyme
MILFDYYFAGEGEQMSDSTSEVKIRPLMSRDIDAVVNIDHLIRDGGKTITYSDLTTAQVLTAEIKSGPFRRSTNYYLDLVAGDVPGSVGIGFVGEIDGKIRGFVMARTENRGNTKVGKILIIGVEPNFHQRGIATLLLNALYERFRTEAVKEVKVEVHPFDLDLLAFLGKMQYTAKGRIELTKVL